MARNARHAVLVFLLGVSHAEAFFSPAGRPFRRRASSVVDETYCAAANRGVVSVASRKLRGEQDVFPPHFQSDETVAWVQLLLDSFEETFDGQSLIRGLNRESLSPEEQARQVAVADVAVVSHDFLRSADDPIFIYGARERMTNNVVRAPQDFVSACTYIHEVISIASLALLLLCPVGPDWL